MYRVMSRKTKTVSPLPLKRSFETFKPVDYFTQGQMEEKEPSCFNGYVNVRRYRITVEQIEEPKEVLESRLLKLWRETDNHHDWQPLKNAAAQIGITLPHSELGRDRKKSTLRL